MEYIIALIGLALVSCLIFLHGEYIENKNLKRLIDDFEFCCDCVSKFSDKDVECVLVYSRELNMSRRTLLFRMGYTLTDEKEIPAARLPQLVKIQPGRSKIPYISNKECSQIR